MYPLSEEGMRLALPTGHPLAKAEGDEVPLKALSGEPFILYRKEAGAVITSYSIHYTKLYDRKGSIAERSAPRFECSKPMFFALFQALEDRPQTRAQRVHLRGGGAGDRDRTDDIQLGKLTFYH